MKNPQPLINTWNRSLNKDPVLLSVSDANKKFKRKSREPRKLFCSPEPEKIKIYQADMSDDDSVDDTQMEACNVNRLAPLQRALLMSQEMTAGTTGIISGLSESSTTSAHSGAIDMRIGINVPQLPAPPFANPGISHWPAVISQPLPNRLRVGLHSTFPLSASSSISHSHPPSCQAVSLDSSLPGQAAALSLSKTSQDSQCRDHMEPEVQSPKESSKKRVDASIDGLGRLPEVKAIQQTRRLLANARERTRVHTISAAFEALRKQVPCYSYGQKLSKLAILRIACNYILSLAQLAELDYSSDHGHLSFSQCVEQCTRTLQAEGRNKKRKVGKMQEDV